MSSWWWLLPAAYLVGTFPSASWVGRANGVDIRSVGSGNPGASNVARTLGWRRGIWVFVLDAAKAALATAVGLLIGGRPAGYALGIAAVVGHVFPLWHRFRGGKGVASGGGVVLVLHPIVGAVAAALWFAISRLTKKASLASIAVVALIPVGVAVERRRWWEVLTTAAFCGLVMIRHTSNIKRLIDHREHAVV